jgi:hypothetical protein
MDILHFTLLFTLVVLSVSLTYCVWKKDLQQTTSIVKQKRRFTKQDKIVGVLSLAFVFVLLTLQIIK